ncbi:alpha/beta fold hydrolase [Nocardioides sp. AE5]|uniref:alpha/beta hydrolase family protein n=1 Tax=Nocardioides sp. AE5 TaxID=2962573 RepID=UPI0028810579|nr:alpha/beta fold hydrolase [Nocardioides sp. AE5]MDT0202466.1 alpha/beta fold hydrolase [Nocardioides sp. AE5]
METHFVPTGAGPDIPIHWTEAGQGGEPLFAVLGALGTPAAFYGRLASALAERGWSSAVVEQRGLGESAVRPSREADWDFTDVVGTDLPAALAWVRERAGGRPVHLLGHSLGGHYAQMVAGLRPEMFDGLVLPACGSPWTEAYDGPTRAQISQLVEVIPALSEQHGYYPGSQVGFGGDEASGVMADWRHLALTNRYRFAGDDAALVPAIAAYDGPVLAIRMADDAFAPEAAVRACTDRFSATTPEVRVLTAEQIGAAADHFGWAKQPGAVVEAIATWLGQGAAER